MIEISATMMLSHGLALHCTMFFPGERGFALLQGHSNMPYPQSDWVLPAVPGSSSGPQFVSPALPWPAEQPNDQLPSVLLPPGLVSVPPPGEWLFGSDLRALEKDKSMWLVHQPGQSKGTTDSLSGNCRSHDKRLTPVCNISSVCTSK